MIAVTRRGALAGALAVPTLAGLAQWRWSHGENALLLYDPGLTAGTRFAEAGRAKGGEAIALEGDRIRLGRAAFARRPALVAGVSRHADALLLEDVAREAGFHRVAALHGRGTTCAAGPCQPGWQALGRMAGKAGAGWVEALADYATGPDRGVALAQLSAYSRDSDHGLVTGWVLARKA